MKVSFLHFLEASGGVPGSEALFLGCCSASKYGCVRISRRCGSIRLRELVDELIGIMHNVSTQLAPSLSCSILRARFR